MALLQIIGVVFALFALSRVFLRYKDKSIKTIEFLFWNIIWLGVIALALFPGLFTALSRVIGIGRGVDILLYFGMIILFYLIFRAYIKIEGQQKEITLLVREFALRKDVEKSRESEKRAKNKTIIEK